MAKRVKNQNLHARTNEEFAAKVEDYISESTVVETAADLVRRAVAEYMENHPVHKVSK